MKKIFALLILLCASLSVMAFDFAGKTFSNTSTAANGQKATTTLRFTANRVTMTCSGKGIKRFSHTAYWEKAGGYLNIYDPSGDFIAVMMDDDDGEMKLIMDVSSNVEPLVLRQVKSSPKSKSKAKRRK